MLIRGAPPTAKSVNDACACEERVGRWDDWAGWVAAAGVGKVVWGVRGEVALGEEGENEMFNAGDRDLMNK